MKNYMGDKEEYEILKKYMSSELETNKYDKNNIHELYFKLIDEYFFVTKDTINKFIDRKYETITTCIKISIVLLILGFILNKLVLTNTNIIYICISLVISFIIASFIINSIACKQKSDMVISIFVLSSFSMCDSVIKIATNEFGFEFEQSEVVKFYTTCALYVKCILDDKNIKINNKIINLFKNM